LRAGVSVKFHQVERDSWLLNKHSFVIMNFAVKNCSAHCTLLSLELFLAIKGGFCCDIMLLFDRTALKFLTV